MAAAEWVQGAAIAMSCQFHPKYVGTFRKVDAGMAIVAGAFYPPRLYMKKDHICLNFSLTLNILDH